MRNSRRLWFTVCFLLSWACKKAPAPGDSTSPTTDTPRDSTGPDSCKPDSGDSAGSPDSTPDSSDTGPSGSYTGPVHVTSCSDYADYMVETSDEVKLRFIAIYEPDPDAGTAAVEVHLAVSQPTFLVLSTHGWTEWVVTEDDPGSIRGVLALVSRYGATVEAPEGVPVTTTSTAPLAGVSWDSPDTFESVPYAEGATGLEFASFAGCYYPTSFVIEEASEYPEYPEYPDCIEDIESEPFAPAEASVLAGIEGCEGVLSESYYCLTFADDELLAVGLDSGSTCSVLRADFSTRNLAWSGEWLYGCVGSDRMLQRISLATAQVEKSYVWCNGAAIWEDSLLVLPSEEAWWMDYDTTFGYASWRSAECETWSETYPWHATLGSITSQGDALYYSGWTADAVTRVDLPTLLESVTSLEGFNGDIYGLSVTEDGLLVVNASYSLASWLLFDATTGIALGDVDAPVGLGLACQVGGTAG